MTTVPVDVRDVPPVPEADVTDLVEMYRRMRLIRTFEERVESLALAGEIPGVVHASIGHEAAAVGACWPLDQRDVVTSTHRPHGHCLAHGLPVESTLAELMGRATGICRGRGGSLHLADPPRGVLGANGIVGAGLPIACGAATAARLRAEGGVAVAFLGDGALAQGAFHEAVELAAEWRLPVLFCCENDADPDAGVPPGGRPPVPLADRARGHGIDHHAVDGADVVAVAGLATTLVERLREGGPPVLLEVRVHRPPDPLTDGTAEAVWEDAVRAEAAWPDADPIARLAALLGDGALDVLDEVDLDVEDLVEDAVDAARSAPEPRPETLHHYVVVPREPLPEPGAEETPVPPDDGTEQYGMAAAVREALADELAADESVFVAGTWVRRGGAFGATRDLAARFPGRVLDAPIAENALVGAAVGAALTGVRPVVEVMFADFLGVCFDPLLNQAAKLRYMTGGGAELPLVVRTQCGAGDGFAAQHSQSLEALLAHVPGLTVVMPSTPGDAYALLRAAIRDPNPVVFVEHRALYEVPGARPAADLLPLGRAAVRRSGSDVTLVSYSRMLHEALAAAETLAEEGISVEVIDLRTVAPLDHETVLRSLATTNRLVVAHEAVGPFGAGAELAAVAADAGFWTLDAPVLRVTGAATPVPYGPALERAWLPGRARIAAAVREVVRA